MQYIPNFEKILYIDKRFYENVLKILIILLGTLDP